MQSIFLINYNGLISWVVLTLSAMIALSVLYRFATVKRNENINIESQQSEEQLPDKFIFISANVDEATYIMRSASEDTKNNYFNKAVQKSNKAISLVLAQLLKYFNIENKSMNVDEMFQELLRNGVTLHINRDNFTKFNEIIRKDIENEKISKEETIWVLNFSGFIIENVKEVRIDKSE